MRKVLVLVLVTVFAAVGFAAQEKTTGEKKAKKKTSATTTKQDRWSGTILRQNKDASTLTVRKGNIEKTVVYDSSTTWTKLNKPAEASLFKDGERVIVLGKYDEKGRLVASRIDLRLPR